MISTPLHIISIQSLPKARMVKDNSPALEIKLMVKVWSVKELLERAAKS